ncbi:MAG: two-component regulator propeller domain-containing protein, partial [Ginsengibacter sp.]
PNGQAVIAIYEDGSGVLWYGGNPGLVRKEGVTGTEKHFVNDPANPHSLSHDNIFTIYEDLKGELWIGAWRGLNKYARSTGTVVRYRFNKDADSILTKESIQAIHEDKSGILWFGTTGGLLGYNRQTKSFIHYRHIPNDSNSLSHNEIYCMYEDIFGILWLGSRTDGLNELNPQSGKVQRFLAGANIHCLCQDSEGILWVGTSIGLYKSNHSLNNFSLFTGPNAEFAGKFVVNGILEDDKQNLWLNASSGICRLNPKKSEVVIFTRHEDPIHYNGTGYYKGKKGELYFGGTSGYFAFFPDQIRGNTIPPQIVLAAFRIADKVVLPGEESILKQSLSQTKEIRLHYDQNVFSFGFAGIHYSNPKGNHHLYMLEGLDNTWRKGGEENTAYYYKVPPGHYIFKVKAANSDGVWAEKSIKLIILPPWYRTSWAYLLFVSIVAGLIYAFIKYRINGIRIEHEMILQKHKAAELEMQALRAQMSPHFIFNSLNSINKFILQSDKLQASEYLTKFSRLVRLILQNSQASLITLESELEALRLYLELEALRFDNQFDFNISVAEDLDIEILKVAPLIIQPYAENAIWHGLMHKDDKGHLAINIYQEEDHILCCKITDDGVGRNRAAELKSKLAPTHKSMGMRITAARIEMLQQNKQLDTTIKITDLVLADGSAGGTEVMLKIPIVV